MSFNCRGLLTQFYGPILAQEQPLISTPETTMPHPLEKPTSLNLLLSLTSSLPLLSENSILGRSFRTHAFLSCSGGAETLKRISLREFNYTLGVGFVGKMWEVSHRSYCGKFLTDFIDILQIGRLELNYCFPLSGNVKPGLRLSLGAEFL